MTNGTKLAAGLTAIAIGAVIAAIVGFSQASSSDDDATAAENDLAAAVARADEGGRPHRERELGPGRADVAHGSGHGAQELPPAQVVVASEQQPRFTRITEPLDQGQVVIDELAFSEGQVVQSLIALNKALGGGWSPDRIPAELIVAEEDGYTAEADAAQLLAGLGVGFWSDSVELESIWRRERLFEPCMGEARREELCDGWRRAVRQVLTGR